MSSELNFPCDTYSKNVYMIHIEMWASLMGTNEPKFKWIKRSFLFKSTSPQRVVCWLTYIQCLALESMMKAWPPHGKELLCHTYHFNINQPTHSFLLHHFQNWSKSHDRDFTFHTLRSVVGKCNSRPRCRPNHWVLCPNQTMITFL